MKRELVAVLVVTCMLLVSFGNAQEKFRVEKDLLGEKQIPADAMYGVQTARALENFPVLSREFSSITTRVSSRLGRS
jgi:aspartate ammonia-lyase